MNHINIITPYGQTYKNVNEDMTLDELKDLYQTWMEYAQKGEVNFFTLNCSDGKKVTMSGELFKQCIVEIW